MAMIACAECGGSTSTAAANCPHCGVTRKAMVGRQPITLFGWAWRALLGAVALLMVATAWTAKDQSNTSVAVDEVTPREHAEATARLHSAVPDVAALKRGLRDPASLELDRVLASSVGDVVCVRYRARNGFGGTNRDGMVFVDDDQGSTSRRLWRRRCMHGGLVDLTRDVTCVMK